MLVPIPHSFPKRAREIVRETEILLKDAGINEIDAECLRLFAYHCYKMEQIRAQLEATGLVLQAGGRTVPNPLLKMHRDESAIVLRYMNALGMSPQSRKLLGITLQDPGNVNSLLGDE
jgi:P27 family predicted phage terminase small subunit